MATIDAVCDAFARQAQYCDAYGSPFTARLLRCLTQMLMDDEPRLLPLACWPGDPQADALPLRLAGALHALVLDGRAAGLMRCYPGGGLADDDVALRHAVSSALDAHPQWLADYLSVPPQTNEVGRSAVLWGGFQSIAVQTGLPLRLFELGASAGLNMYTDRYRYRFGDTIAGDLASPLELVPIWHGERPPMASPCIVSRAACDQAPVDITDAVQRQHLRAYVWADQTLRLHQLDAALEIAGRHPFQVEQADAADWIEQALFTPLPAGLTTVVYHSIFWSYLPAAAQARIEAALHRAGQTATAEAPLAWLRFEIGDFQRHPQLLLSLWPGPQDVHLADAQAHGSEVFWHGAGVE